VPLIPRILNEFLVESILCQLPVTLDRDEASRRIEPGFQNQLKIVENMTDIPRLEMQLGDDAKLRLQWELTLEHLREKSCRNLIGKGIAASAGGFYWRAVLCHLWGQNTPLL